MKPSRRNIEKMTNRNAKLAAGKPLLSKYERKRQRTLVDETPKTKDPE